MTRRFERRLAGIAGCLGAFLVVLADLFTLYVPRPVDSLAPALPLLSLDNLVPYILSKPHWQILTGHYLALVGIPLSAAGIWPIYWALNPEQSRVARVFLWLSLPVFMLGLAFHSSFAFVIPLLQTLHAPGATVASAPVLAHVESYFQPIGNLTMLIGTIAFLILLERTLRKRSLFPRAFALANPVVVQLVVYGIVGLVPYAIGVPLFMLGLSLSLLVLFTSTALWLWIADPAG